MNAQKLITLVLMVFSITVSYSQYKVSGTVTSETNKPLNKVQIYDESGGLMANSNSYGQFSFNTSKQKIGLIFYVENYQLVEKKITLNEGENTLQITMNSFTEELTEIVIQSQKRKVFELARLKDVEQTAIYAGKKTEVVLLNQATVNLASNNARQIYSQVVGLNIFENDDAGLQLNIGGRGLDPNRTANFNTRQNGYDISADVLGYPESYYSPPAEAVDQIQIVRGAASLQYGTQFGGLVNFVFKKPNPNKQLEVLTRNTLGSNNLFTNFTSVSGTSNKLSYFAYYNYKRGDGFRPNSKFESKNAFAHVGYEFNSNIKLEAEVTYLNYLAQQAGGLSDAMFEENPYQSNRNRNWFKVDWLLYNLKYSHSFSENTKLTFSFFGLDASRKAVGFRDRRVENDDPGFARELLTSDFSNFGFEARLLDKYRLFNKEATYLVGVKYYNANNSSIQGPGTSGSDADFRLAVDQYPNYTFQSNFANPNENVALFAENIFYVNDKISITPGVRLEYINTGSNGFKKKVNLDGAGNPIGVEEGHDDFFKERYFALFGVGVSYKAHSSMELYANISQNYRSITFSDVNVVNPSNAIDPNLKDEKGFTGDIGIRGDLKKLISYDIGAFAMLYNDRIGSYFTTIPPVNNLGLLRTNIGNARIVGIESLIDFNLKKLLNLPSQFSSSLFINTSLINSEYTSSEISGITGNKVEFVPDINFKTGLKFGYDNFTSSIQYSYLSEQFNDADNSPEGDPSNPVRGIIPAYDVLDLSASYKYKIFKLEAGVNNALNNQYFTRRATGYPGPGIIPSAPRTYYVTLEFKF